MMEVKLGRRKQALDELACGLRNIVMDEPT